MSSFWIKIIAIICMTMDHYNDVILGHFTFLQVIGRITFPLFCFQLVIGFEKTKSIPKYLLRLAIFALISQWPYSIFLRTSGMQGGANVIFTFLIGLIAICIYELKLNYKIGEVRISLKNKQKIIQKNISPNKYKLEKIMLNIIKIPIIYVLLFLAKYINADYKMWGILLMLFINIFYPFNDEINIFGEKIKIEKFVNISLFLIGMVIFSFTKYIENWTTHPLYCIVELVIATFSTSFIMLAYNGKKGPSMKYFFYIYYPLQFILLVLLKNII